MITHKEALEVYEYKDGNLYWKVARPSCGLGKRVGSPNKKGYIRTRYKGEYLYLHRLIFLYHHGYMPKQVDHINGNKADNRIENLRESSQSQNMWNRKTNKNSKTGIKGVTPFRNKFRARVTANYKPHTIGYFDTIEEAKRAIENYRNQLHKEFARHE